MSNKSQNNQSKYQEDKNMNSTKDLIESLVLHFNENPKSFTRYRKEIEVMLKENIKPLAPRSQKSGDDWRDEIKNRFGGRGAKWVFLSLNEIEPTIVNLENSGIDCSNYRKWTTKAGKAWVRYTAARIHNGKKCACFAVLNEGSTINKPKQLHFVSVEGMDEIIDPMPGTPKALKLEEDSAPMPNKTNLKEKTEGKPYKKKVKEEKEVELLAEEINLEMEIEKELNSAPDSSDPSEWEAFLAAEGLINDDLSDDNF